MYINKYFYKFWIICIDIFLICVSNIFKYYYLVWILDSVLCICYIYIVIIVIELYVIFWKKKINILIMIWIFKICFLKFNWKKMKVLMINVKVYILN